MTTFSRTNENGSMSPDDPKQITQTATNIGGLMAAEIMERSGGDYLDHTLTDNSGAAGSWIRRWGINNEQGDANARFSLSVWELEVESEHTSSFTLTADDGTANGKSLSWSEWDSSSGTYDWFYEVSAIAGSGTGDWDATASGNTSDPGGSDLFELAVAGCRNSTDEPTTGNVTFTDQTDDNTEFIGGNNNFTHLHAIEAAGQSGATSSTINSDGTGNEGASSVGLWSDGGVTPDGGNPAAILVGL